MMIIDPYRFAAAGGGSDPNFSSTVLLLGFEGADGSTTFTDESFAAQGTATAVLGNAQVDTAQFKFGSSSAMFDGSADVIAWTDRADWELGSGLFTIECFYRTNTVTGDRRIIAKRGNLGSRSFMLRGNGAALQWVMSSDGSTEFTDLSGGTLSTGTWLHLCVDFDGTTYRLYLDGSMVDSSTTLRTIHNNTANLTVGADNGAGSSVDGWIDEVRITKGVARYANDSGFTVPTAAFPRS